MITLLKTANKCANWNKIECDLINGCTWCKSANFNGSCYTLDDATNLPPTFSCDKGDSFKERDELITLLKRTDECSYGTKTECDANDACSWCKSAAVKSSCHTLEDAKKLPPGVFICDKVGADDERDELITILKSTD